MPEVNKIACLYLGHDVYHASGKWGTLASIDCEGVCLIEFNDGTKDVLHYDQLPQARDIIATNFALTIFNPTVLATH